MTPLQAHLRRLRLTGAVFLASLPLIQVAAVILPGREAGLSPGIMTLLAAAGGLWLSFTAERDARARLDRIKRAFAVHGRESQLLRDHLGVYLVVLFRLEAIAGLGLVAAVWGTGPTASLWFLVIVAVLMLLAWPTAAKTGLLLDRARALRPPGD